MKVFNYSMDHHYLFTDGKIRKPYFMFGSMASFREVDLNEEGVVSYDINGEPVRRHRLRSLYPDIILCIEDPTSWSWRMTTTGISVPQKLLFSEFVINGRIFTVKRSNSFVNGYALFIDGSRVTSPEPIFEDVIEAILRNATHGPTEACKQDPIKEKYEKAREALEELGDCLIERF